MATVVNVYPRKLRSVYAVLYAVLHAVFFSEVFDTSSQERICVLM
jgi:hypothetical protein